MNFPFWIIVSAVCLAIIAASTADYHDMLALEHGGNHVRQMGEKLEYILYVVSLGLIVLVGIGLWIRDRMRIRHGDDRTFWPHPWVDF